MTPEMADALRNLLELVDRTSLRDTAAVGVVKRLLVEEMAAALDDFDADTASAQGEWHWLN